ncbi:MAG: sigma 54-interacting transcriptional regulator [Tissierellia bacterium]|nr:sigma 54-interacting transcriptional regulator [Tissierellia bacterium]
MDSELLMIRSFLDPCVHIISSLIETQVSIVDVKLNRICASVGYESQSLGRQGPIAHHVGFHKKVLETGQAQIELDICSSEICQNCPTLSNCFNLAMIGYPIYFQGEIIGVIIVSAHSKREQDNIVKYQNKLLSFLEYISLLIVSQLDSIAQVNRLEEQVSNVIDMDRSYTMIGNSPKMLACYQLAERVATSDSTILITGESGTGKEEMVKYFHSKSRRAGKPMIAINCGAIPDTLIESELFGYEGGSFTSAKKSGAIGKIELADQGTLFLDEVGELSLSAQTKLLRFLQERVIERVGGSKSIPVDVRILCATNRDLKQMVEENKFREDLYYRLNVIPMEMPPLRERERDTILLANHFLNYYNQKMDRNIVGFTPNAEAMLQAYSWPGNVRELRNLVEYLVNIVQGKFITDMDIPPHIAGNNENSGTQYTLKELVRNYERSILEKRISGLDTHENKLALAAELGISPATLYRKLASYNL